ncbi:hypothetical protein RFI_11708 [Reticulomyxa filosa]|uniref:Uncharacterized protein n=1 Tax=Reticulomyxa filosa TaxID=46433 RepID=X6NIA2_RETFI|nr:hypothetical protein RFI_11708 [Reticulomyxa filosa]|eukprot:ETO25429.1 hypothetical protein RFI_11708 [Reticulomyxa filosa]
MSLATLFGSVNKVCASWNSVVTRYYGNTKVLDLSEFYGVIGSPEFDEKNFFGTFLPRFHAVSELSLRYCTHLKAAHLDRVHFLSFFLSFFLSSLLFPQTEFYPKKKKRKKCTYIYSKTRLYPILCKNMYIYNVHILAALTPTSDEESKNDKKKTPRKSEKKKKEMRNGHIKQNKNLTSINLYFCSRLEGFFNGAFAHSFMALMCICIRTYENYFVHVCLQMILKESSISADVIPLQQTKTSMV